MRCLTVCVLLLVCAAPALGQNPTHLGEKAPSFRFGTFANATVPYKTLGELKGDVVLLCWVGTFCPGCRAIMPGLEKTRREIDRSDFHVFAPTNDSVELVRRYLVHESVGRKYDVPTVVRNNADWGITRLPWAYVIGRDGKIAWAGHPAQGFTKAVKAALAAPDPEFAEAPRNVRKAATLLGKRQYAKALAIAKKANKDEATAAFGKWIETRVERDAKRAADKAKLYLSSGDAHGACKTLEEAKGHFKGTPQADAIAAKLEKLQGDERCKPWRELERILKAARSGSPEKISRRLKPLLASADEKLSAAAKELREILVKPWTQKDAVKMGGLPR